MESSLPYALLFLSLLISQAASSSSPSHSASHSASSPPVPLVLVNLLIENRASPQTIQQNLNLLPMGGPDKVKYCGISVKNNSREFFLDEDFHHGMEILFPVSPLSAITFAAHAAKKPNFPTKELPAILDEFGLKLNSSQAQALNETLMICKAAPLPTEKKRCVTSVEGMLKFVVSVLGHDLRLYNSQIQDYSILELKVFSKEFVASNVVACHKLVFPYSLYLCHSFSHTKTYQVQLMGGRWGSKATQIITCHEDTSYWNPNHIAFKVLGVKPGDKTICHTNTIDSLVWGGFPS